MPKEEVRVSKVCWCLWSIIAWECAHLGFDVHVLCHYCEIAVTAAGNKVWKHLKVAWRVVSLGWGFNISIFRWFPVTPTSSHLDTVSSSVYSGYLLSTYSCGIRVLSDMEYGVWPFDVVCELWYGVSEALL